MSLDTSTVRQFTTPTTNVFICFLNTSRLCNPSLHMLQMKGHFCQSTTTDTASLPVILLLLLASSAGAQVYGQNCEIIDVPEFMSRCQDYGKMEFLTSPGKV